jgi:hypothetical protein
LLFQWFVGVGMGGQVSVPTVFTMNRDRRLQGAIAEAFLCGSLDERRKRGRLSGDYLTLLKA